MHKLALTTLALLPALATAQQSPQKNIVQTAVAAGQFKTLATALGKAGLVDALSGKGPFTVFAPTDEAFAKLPKGLVESLLQPENKAKLTAILTYHVVSGSVDARTAIQAGKAKTLQGETIRAALKNGRLQINNANVVANDVRASNGIIHIIDTVLLPKAATESKPAQLTRPQVLSKIILDAIDTGVPLFNDGKTAECAAIYRLAAFSVLNLGADQLNNASKKALGKALTNNPKNTADAAWKLREALDITVMALLKKVNASTKADVANMETKDLFDFSDPKATWRAVNDNVMGGISKGRMTVNPETRTAIFAGQLSLENNGGFSSLRSPEGRFGLAGYDGVVLRVRGDGRTYKVSATSSNSRWGARYQAEFDTRDGEWQEIRVPFASMKLSFRGRSLSARELEGKAIRGFGLLIGDKNESPFRLEIDWIKGYRTTAVDATGGGI